MQGHEPIPRTKNMPAELGEVPDEVSDARAAEDDYDPASLHNSGRISSRSRSQPSIQSIARGDTVSTITADSQLRKDSSSASNWAEESKNTEDSHSEVDGATRLGRKSKAEFDVSVAEESQLKRSCEDAGCMAMDQVPETELGVSTTYPISRRSTRLRKRARVGPELPVSKELSKKTDNSQISLKLERVSQVEPDASAVKKHEHNLTCSEMPNSEHNDSATEENILNRASQLRSSARLQRKVSLSSVNAEQNNAMPRVDSISNSGSNLDSDLLATPTSSTKRMPIKYSAQYLLTNPKSALTRLPDLSMLVNEEGFRNLLLTDREELVTLIPERFRKSTKSPVPEFFQSEALKTACSELQEDIERGCYTKKYADDFKKARDAVQAGKMAKAKNDEFELWWGQKAKVDQKVFHYPKKEV